MGKETSTLTLFTPCSLFLYSHELAEAPAAVTPLHVSGVDNNGGSDGIRTPETLFILVLLGPHSIFSKMASVFGKEIVSVGCLLHVYG